MEKFKLLDVKITEDIVNRLCTNINFLDFDKYLKLCIEDKLSDAVELILDIYDSGFSVIDILDNLFIFIKINNNLSETHKYELIKLLCKYITIFHNVHEDEIELCLLTNNIVNLFI